MGLTPLHMAAGYANPETMKLLIATGADTTLVGEKQGTALSVVQSLGQYQWEKFYKEEKKGLQDRFKKKDEKLEKLRKCMDAFEVSGRPRTRDTARATLTPRRRHAQDMETLRAELDWDAELTEVLKVLSTSEAAE